MLRLALRSIRANWARLVATVVAIVLGVGFLAAGRMLTQAVSSSLRASAADQYREVGAVVTVPSESADVGVQVPDETVAAIRGVPGVAAAAGRLDGTVALLRNGKRVDRSVGRSWVRDGSLTSVTLERGRAPRATDEIAVDRGLADEARVTVGNTVRLATAAGMVEMKVVGITRSGNADTLDDGGTVSFSEAGAFEYLNRGKRAFTDVLVRSDGVSEGVLVRRVRSVLPAGLEVRTGQDFRDEQGALAASIADALSPVLQAFGFLTLFVCAFVIYNTFSVVIAQRQRELALMRAIGATPKQVRRSIRLEGLAVGLIGSTIGLVAGAVFAKTLQFVLRAAGVDIPGSGVQITLGTIVLGLGVGSLVTVLSVLPAGRRAARTAPVEALRATTAGTTEVAGSRTAGGLVLVLGGGALLVGSTVVDLPGRLIAPAVIGFIAGMFVAGPTFARAVGAVLRRPLARLGFQGRLAADGLLRNPKRAATTANALVIGVFLVTLVTVAGSSLRSWAVEKINSLDSADFTLSTQSGSLPPTVLDAVRQTDGVTIVAPVTAAPASIDGQPVTIYGGAPDGLRNGAEIGVSAGSLNDLTGGGIAVADLTGTTRVGQKVTVVTADGKTRQLPVVAILKVGIATIGLDRIVGPETFRATFGAVEPQSAFVRVRSDRFDEVRRELDGIVAPYANIEVSAGNDLGRLVGDVISFLIDAVNGLLLMAIVVALVGIVNTLSLAIIERRHELGLLRAVGMTPGQVRSSVRWESLAIAGMGTVVGMFAGALLALVAVSAIGVSDVLGSVDWWRVAVVAVGGIVVGVLAALVPAWRATRIDILDALRAS